MRSRRAGSPIREMADLPVGSAQGRREEGAAGEPDSYRVIRKGKVLAQGRGGYIMPAQFGSLRAAAAVCRDKGYHRLPYWLASPLCSGQRLYSRGAQAGGLSEL